jgi:hypothetical protein
MISGHSTTAQIEDSEFQDHWDKLKESILEIENQLTGGNMWTGRGVDELLSCNLNPSRTEKYVKEFKEIQGKCMVFNASVLCFLEIMILSYIVI